MIDETIRNRASMNNSCHDLYIVMTVDLFYFTAALNAHRTQELFDYVVLFIMCAVRKRKKKKRISFVIKK